MSHFLTFLLLGLGAGAAYAALGLGLVVTYKGTGVINFAAGAMAAWGAYVFDELRQHGNLWLPIPFNFRSQLGAKHYSGFPLWIFTIVSSAVLVALVFALLVKPLRKRSVGLARIVGLVAIPAAIGWGFLVFGKLHGEGRYYLPIIPSRFGVGSSIPAAQAFVIAVALAGLLGLAIHLLVFRPLRNASPLAKVVASVALMSTLSALIVLRFGSAARAEAPLFPNRIIGLGGTVHLPRDRIFVSLVAIGLGAALWAFFRFTRMGLATRAAAESERSAALAGWSPQFLGGATWVIASMTMAALVIFTLPIIPLTANAYTLMIVPGLACALVGRLSGIWVTLVAALSLGSLQSLIGYYSTQSWWPHWASVGVNQALPFIILIVVLFAFGKSIPTRAALRSSALPKVVTPRNRAPVILSLIGVALVLIFSTSGSWRFSVITSMILALAALSLVVVTGLTGQISLAQATLAGTAGFAVSRLAAHGLGFPWTILLAAVVASTVGLVVGLPALRIRGAQLAVVTLAIGVALDGFLFTNPSFTPPGGAPVPGIKLFGWNLGVRGGSDIARWQFGLVVLVFLVVVGLGASNLMRSGTGRRLIAVRNNERAGASVGINVASSKLTAFAIAAAIAGIAGALIGYSRGLITPDSFSTDENINFLVFAYIGGITSFSGALLAGVVAPLGIFYFLVNNYFHLGTQYTLVAGLLLLVTVIQAPAGWSGVAREHMQVIRNAVSRRIGTVPPAEATVGAISDPSEEPRDSQGVIAVRSLPEPRSERGLLLRTTDLSVHYGGVKAVAGVNLEVREHEIVGLIGPNGAGKTSVMDALTGFTASSGEVELCGERIDRLPPHQRSRRGLARTWQSVELFEDLTIAENVRVGAESRDLRDVGLDFLHPCRRRTEDGPEAALTLLSLERYRDSNPSELSLGRQKLAGVARAISLRPDVLLLDEPAAGLDSGESLSFGSKLQVIAEDGTGILLIDHDMGLVLSVCDYVYVLVFGRIIAEGTPAEIRSNPSVVEAYLGASSQSLSTTTVEEVRS